ncbi:MAG: hypothetical protein RIR87_991 [Actinomycetota bacterium]
MSDIDGASGDSMSGDGAGSPYSRLVGERLRSIRLQKNMALGDVETRGARRVRAR